MKNIAAAEAKNKFGQLIDSAQREPVTIEKKGRAVAVVMSLETFQHYEKLEEEMWALKAKAAKGEGFMSAKDSKKFLDDI